MRPARLLPSFSRGLSLALMRCRSGALSAVLAGCWPEGQKFAQGDEKQEENAPQVLCEPTPEPGGPGAAGLGSALPTTVALGLGDPKALGFPPWTRFHLRSFWWKDACTPNGLCPAGLQRSAFPRAEPRGICMGIGK